MTSTLHHRFDGPADAPALICSGSLGSTLAMWDPVLPALAGAHRVLRYDHPGHGGSPVPDGATSMASLGLGLVELLDDHGVERASICGLSLGGMVAMWLAQHHPERVDRLALLCTSAQLGPPSGWDDRIAAVRAAGSAAAVAPAVVERWFTPGFRAARPADVAVAQTMIATTPAEGYARCCEAIRDWDGIDALPSIRAPTVVIAGREDPSTPPEHLERITAGIPGARLEVLSPGAHLIVAEQPDAVGRIVTDHLEAPQ
jgi:3-oxoadipate enol-lactonase